MPIVKAREGGLVVTDYHIDNYSGNDGSIILPHTGSYLGVFKVESVGSVHSDISINDLVIIDKTVLLEKQIAGVYLIHEDDVLGWYKE